MATHDRGCAPLVLSRGTRRMMRHWSWIIPAGRHQVQRQLSLCSHAGSPVQRSGGADGNPAAALRCRPSTCSSTCIP